jgi:hypothetical protein
MAGKKKEDSETIESGAVMLRSHAINEVKSWLDFKKISDQKRIALQVYVNRIAKALAYGKLILDPESKIFKMILSFPIGKEGSITELKFKPRLTVTDIQNHLAGARTDEETNVAYISSATGEAPSVIGMLDLEDYHLAGDLVIFFQIAG